MEHKGGRREIRLQLIILCFIWSACGPSLARILQSDDCSLVKCPEVKECPSDSSRFPTVVDAGHETCCPPPQNCHCNPGILCPSPPHCQPGWEPAVVSNFTGAPGKCCPIYECQENEGGAKVVDSDCSFNGDTYEAGEVWTHTTDCTECNCRNGVVSCKPIECDLHSTCTLVRPAPGSCCPVCVGCIGASGTAHNNSDVWEEDPCTTCECTEGRITCHAAMCQTTCLNPKYIPGECCPRCTNGPDCPSINCHRDCPHGFRSGEDGCPTCKCNKCRSMADCVKDCGFGFETNEKGCPTCHCRVEEDEGSVIGHDIQVHHPRSQQQSGLRVVSNSDEEDDGLKCQEGSDGEERANGEEWFDGCRKCACKNGKEMCSLITCPLPQCEHPVFYPGKCCPRCPKGEHSDPLQVESDYSVCAGGDGSTHISGETWKIGNCLTCTCHRGQVLCSSPDCPPTPCAGNRIQRDDGDCCFRCSSTNHTSTNGSVATHSTNCFSDDSQKVFAHGEMWKVGACQSCVCQDGQVQCFSGGRCLPLKCERPILAKNQCCPICLEGKSRRRVTFLNDLSSRAPEEYDSSDEREGAEEDFPIKSRASPPSTSSKEMIRDEDDKGLSPPSELEPYCAIIITVLASVLFLLFLYIARTCFFRRRIRLTKKIPFHSSRSSGTGGSGGPGSSPPVTPDCCYKYMSCATNSEQKTPLCHDQVSSRASNSILSGDKV